MKIIKLIIGFFIMAGGLTSCIERYYSDFEADFKPQLVIDASITPDEGMQEIVISLTSSPDDPQFIPVSDCKVRVEDDKGNLFFFSLATPGHYRGVIDGSKVIIGAKYRLSVTTSNGKQYMSDFEELLPCPPIDSLYFALETKPTGNPMNSINGLQFYLDFNADDSYGHYYRLEMVETYEYHSQFPLQKWKDQNDIIHNLDSPDYSNMVCYKTSRLPNILNLSTEGFSNNRYPKFKLHYLKDQTPILKIKYSLLVNQYSMDKKAYSYWENLRKNNQETTDLFGKQPALIKGNMVNVNDSSDVALGYFGVSSVQRKRIIVHRVDGLSFDKAFVCKARKIFDGLPEGLLVYLGDDFDDDGVRYEGIIPAECIFCRLLGGNTVKPPYWDEK